MSAADNYAPGREQVQVTASPNISTVQARYDPNADSTYQLAHALGVAIPEAQKLSDVYDKHETIAGTQAANGMTVDELGKMVKSGDLKASHSPAYVAAVQHIYGQNMMQNSQRETLSGIARGDLRFDSSDALDKHLVEKRNAALSGQSKYTIAGFDKGWDQFGQLVTNANATKLDAEYVAQGTAEGIQSLGTVVSQITTPGFAGTPEEGARQLIGQMEMLRVTTVLQTPEQVKAAWNSTLTTLTESGNKPLVAALLSAKMPDGMTVESLIGGEKARAADNRVRAVDEQTQRQRVDVELRPFLDAAEAGDLTGGKRKEFDSWVTANEPWITTATRQTILNAQRVTEDRLARQNNGAQLDAAIARSVDVAQKNVTLAVSNGTFAFLPPLTTLSKDGTERPFDAKAYATTIIPGIVQDKKLNLQQEMMLWSTNNVANPQWAGIIQAGGSNLASVGWSADGKNPGQLNEQGKAALEMYTKLHQVNPAEAEQYAGKDAKLFGDIMFLQSSKGGFPDINTAAALANQIHHSGMTTDDSAVKVKEINSNLHDLTDPSLFSFSNNSLVSGVKNLFGIAGNQSLNFSQVASDVKRRATLLVLSGQVPDAKAAISASMEYLANPAVTTKVNGTLYYNSNLPHTTEPEGGGVWLGKFIADKPKAIGKEMGFGDGSNVRLEPNTTGGFTGWIGGVPLINKDGSMVTYQKKDVEDWISKTAHDERVTRTLDTNIDSFRERMLHPGMFTPGPLDPYTTHMVDTIKFNGEYIKNADIVSPANWKRLKAEGLTHAPIEQILQSTLNARKKK